MGTARLMLYQGSSCCSPGQQHSCTAAGNSDQFKDGKTKSLVAFSPCHTSSLKSMWILKRLSKWGLGSWWTTSFIPFKTHNCTVPYTSCVPWRFNIHAQHTFSSHSSKFSILRPRAASSSAWFSGWKSCPRLVVGMRWSLRSLPTQVILWVWTEYPIYLQNVAVYAVHFLRPVLQVNKLRRKDPRRLLACQPDTWQKFKAILDEESFTTMNLQNIQRHLQRNASQNRENSHRKDKWPRTFLNPQWLKVMGAL